MEEQFIYRPLIQQSSEFQRWISQKDIIWQQLNHSKKARMISDYYSENPKQPVQHFA